MRSLLRHTSGAVYVEFLLVFLPVFLLFLAVLQLGFVYTTRLAVQHASTRAARTAVVVLDDDPAHYGRQPRNQLTLTGTAGSAPAVDAYLRGLGLPGGAPLSVGGPRFRDIRSAASLTLLAVSPTTAQLSEVNTISNALRRVSLPSELYSGAALAVTFPTAPGADTFRTNFGPDDQVTVRVTYIFHCGMPLVPALMCDSPSELAALLTGEEAAQLELGYLAGLPRARYLVLRSETTLQNQGTANLYPSEVAQ